MIKKVFLVLLIIFFSINLILGKSFKEREKEGLKIAKEAKALANKGDFKNSFKLYEKAAFIFKDLMSEEPANPNHIQNYKHCIEMPAYIQLMEAIKCRKKGDFENAARYFKAAMDIYGEILKEFPNQKNFENNYKYAKHYWYVEKFKVLEKKRGKAFDFTALKIPMGVIKLKDFFGKVVLLEFWVSWCPESRKSFSMLEQIYQKYKNKGVSIIALSMDKVGGYFRKGGDKRAEELSKKYHYIFGYASPTTSNEYGYIDAVPKVFLIDRKGRIFKRLEERERTAENISKLIKRLLKES